MRTPKFIAAAAAASLLALPGVAAADGHGAQVTVVHGIPGATVDVYVNDALTLEDFTFETITDPIDLPAGDYSIEIFAADADPESAEAILATDSPVAVTDGLNASIIAHLNGEGNPALAVAVNNVDTLDEGQARLSVRHAANAPNVDVLADGGAIVEDAALGDFVDLEVPAGTYDVAITAAGAPDTVVTEVAGFELAEGVNTIVYAVGDLEGETFTLLVDTIDGLHSTPDTIDSGEAGLATDSGTLALTAAGLLILAGAALGLRRRATDVA